LGEIVLRFFIFKQTIIILLFNTILLLQENVWISHFNKKDISKWKPLLLFLFFFPPSIFGEQDFWAMDFSSCPHVYHNYAPFWWGILLGSRPWFKGLALLTY
jgi:hypothetical protein